ncbi:MAG TPA: GGDEF domain-containing protein [Pirellulaceae bacterium]|nr:GGDEF domain-containing protein [Pirellulaceae bacterium]
MLLFVLIVGIFNIALGYGLAVFLAARSPIGEPPLPSESNAWPPVQNSFKIPVARDAQPIPQSPKHEDVPCTVPDRQPPAPPAASIERLSPATIDELPQSWRMLLDEEQFPASGFVDALARVLRLQLAKYRQPLLAAEARARLEQDSPEALEQLVADIRFLHQEWMGKLLQGAEMLHARRGRLGDAAQSGARLENLLSDHAARMEMLDCRIGAVDIQTDFALGCRKLLAELLKLTAAVHLLRDDLTAALADILTPQKILPELPESLRLDPLTRCFNRLGLATLAEQPSEDSCSRQAILIALEHFGKINERFGTQVGDLTLKAFIHLVDGLLKGARATAEIARLTGVTFLLLIDDITSEQAISLAEHLRQSLERAAFDHCRTFFGLSARLGISTVEPQEPLEKLLARLGEAVDAAGNVGGNRCAMADAIGTQLVAPQIVPAISRHIAIGRQDELPDLIDEEGAARGTEATQSPEPEAAVEPAEEVSTSSCNSPVPQCTPGD